MFSLEKRGFGDDSGDPLDDSPGGQGSALDDAACASMPHRTTQSFASIAGTCLLNRWVWCRCSNADIQNCNPLMVGCYTPALQDILEKCVRELGALLGFETPF